MLVEKDDVKLTFEYCAKTEHGFILGLKLKPIQEEKINFVAGTKIDINTLHKRLGHASKFAAMSTAKYYS